MVDVYRTSSNSIFISPTDIGFNSTSGCIENVPIQVHQIKYMHDINPQDLIIDIGNIGNSSKKLICAFSLKNKLFKTTPGVFIIDMGLKLEYVGTITIKHAYKILRDTMCVSNHLCDVRKAILNDYLGKLQFRGKLLNYFKANHSSLPSKIARLQINNNMWSKRSN